jgi:hypothetical protein
VPSRHRAKLAGCNQNAFVADRAKAWIGINLQNLLQPLKQSQFLDGWQLCGQSQKLTGLLELLATTAVVQAEMSDTNKVAGQNMHQKTANEFHCRDGHPLQFAFQPIHLIQIVIILEGDLPIFDFKDAMIADCNPKYVAREILTLFLRKQAAFLFFSANRSGF